MIIVDIHLSKESRNALLQLSVCYLQFLYASVLTHSLTMVLLSDSWAATRQVLLLHICCLALDEHYLRTSSMFIVKRKLIIVFC